MATHFQTNHANRPKSQKTLESQIGVVFGKALSADEVSATISRLVLSKVLSFSDKGEIHYLHTPATNGSPLNSNSSLAPTKPRATTSPTSPKAPSLGAMESAQLNKWESQALANFRNSPATRPRTKTKLLSSLTSSLSPRPTPAQAVKLVKHVSSAGHLTIDPQGKVTYHLSSA